MRISLKLLEQPHLPVHKYDWQLSPLSLHLAVRYRYPLIECSFDSKSLHPKQKVDPYRRLRVTDTSRYGNVGCNSVHLAPAGWLKTKVTIHINGCYATNLTDNVCVC